MKALGVCVALTLPRLCLLPSLHVQVSLTKALEAAKAHTRAVVVVTPL